MDDLRFYVLFNIISVISGEWADDSKRLCAMEPDTVEKISPQARLGLATARAKPSGLPGISVKKGP